MFSKGEIEFKSFDQVDTQIWNSIIKLRNSAFIVEQKCVYQDVDDLDKDSKHAYLQIDEKILAYARIYQTTSYHIGRVAVHRNFRKQQIGQTIMNACIEYIKCIDSLVEIELSGQAYLCEFYRSLGFQIIGSMYLEDGIPHLRMVYSPSLITNV